MVLKCRDHSVPYFLTLYRYMINSPVFGFAIRLLPCTEQSGIMRELITQRSMLTLTDNRLARNFIQGMWLIKRDIYVASVVDLSRVVRRALHLRGFSKALLPKFHLNGGIDCVPSLSFLRNIKWTADGYNCDLKNV